MNKMGLDMSRFSSVLMALLALVSCSRTASTSRQATPLWEPPKEVTVEIGGTLGCPGVTDAPNQWIAFRKDVRLDAVPASVPARIAVDSKYWLWVNGELAVFEGGLKRGPNPQDSYFDEVDLAPYLRKGENQVALLLWYFGKDGFSHLGSGQPQLWFAKQNGIDVRLGDPKEEVPGKSVVLPASPALFQYKEADIDHFRQSLIKKAVKKAGVKPSESDLQFLAEETKTDVAFVTKTLEENGLL